MIREYIEGHKFNSTKKIKSTLPPHRMIWFIKGVIKCDGVLMAFAAWDRDKMKAKKRFQTFLDPKCTCTYYKSQTVPCRIHGSYGPWGGPEQRLQLEEGK